MIKALKFSFVACLAALASSCDVHEFPDPQETPETPVETNSTDITLHLVFDEVMPLHREVIYTRAAFDVFDAYYHVELYRMNSAGEYDDEPYLTVNYVNAYITDLNHDMNLRLRDGRYRVIAWTHYVEDNQIFKHFEFSNLKTTSISDYKAYIGNTDMVDSFRSVTYIDVANSRDQHDYDVPMTRPMAKFEVYATDIDDFIKLLSKENPQDSNKASDILDGKYTARITYSGFVASTYDLIGDYVKDSRMNLSFSGPITMVNEHEARLAFDYLFTNTWGGGVTINMEIFNTQGKRVASVTNVEVPLMQGHLTVLRGEFMSSNSSGIGISADFIGPDFNIRL